MRLKAAELGDLQSTSVQIEDSFLKAEKVRIWRQPAGMTFTPQVTPKAGEQ